MRSMLVTMVVLSASVLADAAPCARPAALPAEVPLMDCPTVECLKGCDRRGQIVARLTYDASPALAARWKAAVEKAGWKVEEKGGMQLARKGHDRMATQITTRGKQATFTITIDPA